MSLPATILPSTPKLPFCIITAALSLVTLLIATGSEPSITSLPPISQLFVISTLLFEEFYFKSRLVVLMVVPSVNPSVILFDLTLP